MKTEFDNTENEALSIARVSKSVILPADLRIGNFIEKSGDICTLASINTDKTIRIYNEDKTDTWGCFALRIFKPIELTEQWLEKLGFSIINENSAGKRYGYVVNGIYSSDLTFTFWKTTKDAGKFFRCDLELTSVHQIQNLYFALTGRELTVC